MTEAEQRDLDLLNATMQANKLATYAYMVSILRYSDQDMLHSGLGKFTKAEAIQKTLVDAERKIKSMIDAHVRKYPD